MNEISQIPETHLGPLVDLIHYYRMGLQAEKSDPSSPILLSDRERFSELSGAISSQAADEMAAAIHNGCERIDADGW